MEEHYEVRYEARRGRRRDAHVIHHDHYCESLEDARSYKEMIEEEKVILVGVVKIVRVLEEIVE